VFLLAHGIVGRADLPIPKTWFFVASAAVLVVSFLALAAGWSQPVLKRLPQRRLFRLPLAAEALLGALGVFLFFLTVYAGLAGTDTQSQNLAPTAVYVGFWVGIPFLSLLIGDIWDLLSPWRALGRVTGWLVARSSPDATPEPLEYPARLGRLPAAVGLFAFAICELAWADATKPGTLAILMLIYFAWMAIGMSLFGVETWVRNGDAFGVLFRLIASLAPIGRDEQGWIVLRVPMTGTARAKAAAGTAVLLVVSVASTAFDGAKEGALFNGLAQDLQRLFNDIGFSLGFSLELAFVVGLFLAVGIVGAVFAAGMAAMPRTASAPTFAALGRAFAHSLIPIAAGYLVAHYFSLLAYNGQDLWRLINDPLGKGSDLFGGADAGIDYGIVSATGIWYVQVGALVIGHVAALVLAHDRALEVYGSARAAARSQLVMLALMVAFTCLGLALLSAALDA
jgi:hypothetical protein